MISILLLLLSRRLSYRIGLSRDFRHGIQGFMHLFIKASRTQSASYPRSPSSQSTDGRLLNGTLAPV
jgi:hypothetical protein